MELIKNKSKWLSFSVVAILFLSFSYITIYPTVSATNKLNSTVLSDDFSSEKENSDSEKDFSEDCLDLFLVENQKINFNKFSDKFLKTQSNFLIPRVFYDIQLLPPEVQVS